MAIESYYYDMQRAPVTNAVDAFGDSAPVVGDFSPFKGFIGKPSSRQALVYAQRGIEVTGRLYAPISAGVQEFDVIRETDENTGKPTDYQVISRPRDVARRGHHIECDLMLLKGGATNAN